MQQVAAGILQDNCGRIFVQQRKDGRWEFPGGKSHPNESPKQTLTRELHEETGIEVIDADLWLKRKLPQVDIEVHFFRVNNYRGKPKGAEGQNCFFAGLHAPPLPMLAANLPVWKWLQLPPVCGITAAEVFGIDDSLHKMKTAFADGLRLVQLRDKNLPQRKSFAEHSAMLARKYKVLLLINDDIKLARQVCADGLHLSSGALAAASANNTRPDFQWVAASCHNAGQLAMAAKLNLDFVVLSPVAKTLTHVDAAPMGWKGFGALAANAEIPVYALGGLSSADAKTARRHNGQGAAMMRKAWE